MPQNRTPWPTSYQYAMAHACPTCKAKPGVECDAPIKQARQERTGEDPIGRLHATRQAAGRSHRGQDVAAAPFVEDRIPGQRYDSLGADVTVSHVEQQVRARIAAAGQRREQRRHQRAELDEARGYGLQARVATKVARWEREGET